jgi:hypothetical protein
MRHSLLLLVASLLLVICFSWAAAPQVLNATYEIKTAVIAGTEYKSAIFNIDFDQNVYLLENFPCPCGSCSSTNLPAVNETGYDISALTLNAWAEDELIGTGSIKYYKFTIDSTQACHNIYVETESLTGFIAVYVSSSRVPVTDDYDWYRPVSGRRHLPICNAHSAFGVGTYYVGVRANNFFNVYNRYKVRVVTQSTGTCPTARTMPSIPDDYPESFQWLQDGVPVNQFAQPDVYHYYGYNVETECTRFAVSAHKNTSLVGDVDLYVSTLNHDIGFRRNLDFRNDWLSNLDGEDSITFYRCSETVPWTIFMAVTAYDLETGYDIVATTQDSTFMYTDISSMQLNSPQNHLARTFRLECSDPNVAANVERFYCEFPAYDRCLTDAGFYCCYPMYPLAAIETPNPYWPWNAANSRIRSVAQLSWDDENYEISWIPNRISFALLMSTRFEDDYFRFVQSEDLSSCKVVWLGQIVSQEGEAISTDTAFVAKDLQCTAAIDDLVHESTGIIEEMSTSTDYLDLTKSHFKINFEYLKEDWGGCNNFVFNFGESETQTLIVPDVRACTLFPNTTAWNEDPCCNAELQFEQCCAAQNLALTSTVMTASPKADAIQAQCVTPGCTKKQVQNLASLQRRVNDLETGCTANFIQEADPALVESLSSFVRDCQVKIWGEQLESVKCSSDRECYSNVCNKTFGVCEQGIEETLSCLADNVTPVVGRFLFNQWGILANVTKDLLVEQLRTRFVIADQCTGPTSIKFRDNFWWSRDEATCTDDCLTNGLETHCLDTLCPILPICDYQQLGLCYRNWYFTQGNVANCLTDKKCNWASCDGLTDDECQANCTTFTNDHFCADCRSGSFPCTEMTDRADESACNAGVCSVDSSIAPNLCANFGSCTALCGGGVCLNETACESSGTCSDLQLFADFIAAKGSVPGVCLSPFVFSLDGSAVCDEASQLQTEVGCAELSVTAQAQCNGASQRWWNFAKSAAECTFTVCQETYNGNSFNTWKTPSECSATCDGTSTNILTWTPGQWSQGTVEPLVWLPRQYFSVNSVGEIFDFISFRNAINNAIVNKLAFAYTTEALCRYDSLVKAVSYIACDCNADIYDGDCAHGDLRSSYLIGALAACPFIESSLNAPPAFLTVFSNTISQNSFCKSVQIDRLPAAFYQVESTLALSSEIYQRRLFNTFSVVKNDQGATIGQIVTDGVNIRIDDSSAIANEFELCIAINDDIGVYSEYTENGFAVLDESTNTIYSTTFEVTRNGDQICAKVMNGTFFGIARLLEWEDEQPFDEQQQQMKWAGVAFYFIGAVFGIFQLIIIAMHHSNLRRTRTKKIIFCTFTLAFLLLRGIYFTFPPELLADSFVIQYLLFELPQFMFFSLYTIILFLWNQVLIRQSVVSKGRSRGRIRRALIGYLVANAFMYAVFVGFVLIYRFWDSSTEVCAIDISTAATQDRFYITLAYRIFIAVVCFGVSLAFMIQGIKFIVIFRKSKMVNTSGKKSRVRILITFVAVLCTALFIGRTIVFLYAAVTGNQVVIIIFVLFEALPCYALLYYLRPFNFKDIFGVSEDTTTQGSSARGVSMNSAKEYPYSNTTHTNHATTNDDTDNMTDGEEYPSDSDSGMNTARSGTLRKSSAAVPPAAMEEGLTNTNKTQMPTPQPMDIPRSSSDEGSSVESSDSDNDSSSSSSSPSSSEQKSSQRSSSN